MLTDTYIRKMGLKIVDNNKVIDKHAYLIIAHDCPKTLRVLLDMIDDERNDVYLHIDKRSDLRCQESDYALHKAKLYMIDRQRVDWGSYSLIECEIKLFEEAKRHGNYNYFHLLSGVDLPLHSQDYIHNFFMRNNGVEYIHVDNNKNMHEISWKMNHIHLFPKLFRSKNIIIRIMRRLIRSIVNIISINKGISFYKGSQWVSITPLFVDYILANEDIITNLFRRGLCGDEIYKQTLLYHNPELKLRVCSQGKGMERSVRLIDWNRGEPYTWEIDDLPTLEASNMMFARKFSDEYFDVVTALKTHVLQNR